MEGDHRRDRLEVVYRAHADAVQAYARRRTDAAQADDVVMEVFVIACRRLDDVPENALPWLLGCARRVLANQRRGAGRADALTERLTASAKTAGVEHAAAERLGEALGRLSDGDREVILLSAWEGLDLAALATVLGCSRSAAGVRLHRARRRLRAALERVGGEGPATSTAEVTT